MKIRASYSFLHEWRQGHINQALLQYFHVPTPTPYNYINGKKWDTYATDYIAKHSTLPPEWGGTVLDDPVPQLKTLVPYNELSTITGVYDVYEKKGVITELKSGHSYNARQYANTMQIPLYFLIAHLAKIPVEKLIVKRYNPKTDKCDSVIIYPSDRMLRKASNYLDSMIPEIYQYFETFNLFGKTDDEMKEILANPLTI
jgi:hypothetical protein